MSVRPPLREQVYRSIRNDLMSGQIAPSERLGEERLAHLYGVSRTPVREALAKLESDGLVERDEHGLFPYRPHLDELGGLYELRILLEVHGLRRVLDGEAPAHDRDALGSELDKWYAFLKQMPVPDAGFVTLDEEFHIALLASSGNHALVDALQAVNSKLRPVRMFDYLTPDRMKATVRNISPSSSWFWTARFRKRTRHWCRTSTSLVRLSSTVLVRPSRWPPWPMPCVTDQRRVADFRVTTSVTWSLVRGTSRYSPATVGCGPSSEPGTVPVVPSEHSTATSRE